MRDDKLIPKVVAVCLIGISGIFGQTVAQTSAELPLRQSELSFEQQKWRDEYQLKKKELDLKEQVQNESRWSNPLVVAILAAALAGISNAIVAVINGKEQRQIEKDRADESLRVEENRSEATRILEMIKTGEPDKAAANLQFLLDTGLIRDTQRATQIQRYLSARPPGTGPVLPSADGRYTFEQSEALTKPREAALQESLDGFIKYLDDLGLKWEVEKVSIKLDKVDLPPYYLPGDNVIVIPESHADNVYAPRQLYCHHVLLSGRRNLPGPNSQALEGGLSLYLSRSYANSQIKVESLPYKSFGRDWVGAPYEGGAIWSSFFWGIRERLEREKTDALVVNTWRKVMANTTSAAHDRSLAQRFDRELLSAARELSPEFNAFITDLLTARKFPI